MKCTHVSFNGLPVIVCGSSRRLSQTCEYAGCDRHATRLCDWKLGANKGTCDALMCEEHTSAPAPNKDLCAKHAAEWEAWKRLHASGRTP